ncbi:hypothetical protein ACVXHA_01435 [Escherichia coli]
MSTLCISQFRYSAQIRPSSVVTKTTPLNAPAGPDVLNRKASTRTTSARSMKCMTTRTFQERHGQNFARWQMDGWRNNAETARGMSRSPEIWPDGELC